MAVLGDESVSVIRDVLLLYGISLGVVLAGGEWNTPPRLWFSQQFIIIQYLTRSGAFQCIIALLVKLLLLVFYIIFSVMLFEGHTGCPVISIT